jgi:hypothetical protein
MKIRITENRPMDTKVSRRRFLTGTAALGTAALFAPRISRAAARPLITHGIQSGDVGTDRAVLWSRADRPASAVFEWSTTDSFKNVWTLPKLGALPETDYTVKLLATDLPSNQDIFYRVKFQDLSDPSAESEPLTGHFRTANRAPRRFLHLVRRYLRPGLGHRRLPRRHEGLFDDASAQSGFLSAFRRQCLCRRRACPRGEAA